MSKTSIPTGGITADAITDAKIADGVVGTEHLTDAEVTFGKLSTSGTEGDNVKNTTLISESKKFHDQYNGFRRGPNKNYQDNIKLILVWFYHHMK